MAKLREIFNKNVVLSYQVKDNLQRSKFYQSGAFVSDSRLRPLLTSGSKTFEVPFIHPIDGNLEANYGNTIMTDIAMPRSIEASKSKGRVAFLNEGFIESRLENYLTGKSPLSEIAKMLDGFWLTQMENRAIATVFGLMNYDHTNGKKLTYDISKTTADDASGFDVNAFIDAEGTLDEAYQGKGIMIVHPLIATKMRKQRLVERVTTADDLKPVETYNGRTVIQSKVGTVIGTGKNAKYVSYLLGRGAFAADMVVGQDDLEIERTANTGNGAGHTTLWTRRHALIHPQGFSFIAEDSALTGGTKNEALSASWTDLQTGTNWQLDATPEQTPIRFLITNL
ncbi:hypothetical protein LU276_03995 [Moraxella haemolytica]|uniref:hypothetical protein n=1 Tax=Moraxella haemolytica TaxID=2904119 RepID=UPI002543F0EC|nr:hypothetical protein [Moraxella sp. ZY171148]WII95984.1 hypothetical protein LU276_03995 [Moraxella sp. ZY171148]